MSAATGQSVGIDVSEQHLDVHIHPAGVERRLPYTAEGTGSLIEMLKGHAVERVVLESTGGLQRWPASRAVEAVHGGVQRTAVQPGDQGAQFASHRPGQVVQAGDDRLHEEARGADEHPRGAKAGLGPVARNLTPDSNRSRKRQTRCFFYNEPQQR